MISFDALSARYDGAALPTLLSVTHSVPRGTLAAVVGPNGSGKSTLIRTLLGRVPVTSGRVTLDGVDLTALQRRDVARRLAVVVQREEPAFAMLVREYVALGRHPHGTLWTASSDDQAAVVSAMARAGVAPLRDRRTDTLSGGEWQRTRLARALAQETPLLALDEPTTFLDVAHEMETFELLASLAAEGRAVLVVSHQLNLVARFAHQVALLHHGRVAAAGPPSDVMQAALLESIYEWPLVVARDPVAGTPMLVPLRR